MHQQDPSVSILKDDGVLDVSCLCGLTVFLTLLPPAASDQAYGQNLPVPALATACSQ